MNTLPIALIPAYMPSKVLPEITKSLINSGAFQSVICVDDGSGEAYSEIFLELENQRVKVLRHNINKGKGAALRTGMRDCLKCYPESVGVVTIDADGQHLCQDAITIAKKLGVEKFALILGSRVFDKKEVPLRSRFGNSLTKYVFSFMTGLWLKDTQTGLRGIPSSFIPKLITLKTNGYDFELDMLIMAKDMHIPIIETQITTIYENGNSTSHFNPVLDSIKIYLVFVRYAWVGVLSFGLDFLMFMLFFNLFNIPLIYSNIIARFISSTMNFILNRKVVFKSKSNVVEEYVKYFILMVCILAIGTVFVYTTYNYVTKLSAVVKILAEVVTFFITFIISRTFIFIDKK